MHRHPIHLPIYRTLGPDPEPLVGERFARVLAREQQHTAAVLPIAAPARHDERPLTRAA